MRTPLPTAPGPNRRGISAEMVPLSAAALMDASPVVAKLVAGVAHEVNNPAAYVGANLAILAEHVQAFERAVHTIESLLADDPARLAEVRSVLHAQDLEHALTDARAIVDENLQGVHRLSGLVRELKTFTRIEPRDLAHVHPNEVVNAACARAFGMTRGRVSLCQELGDVPTLVADRWRLMQIVLQLLGNAMDAVGGDLIDEPSVVIRTPATQDHVVISVLDNGHGIPDAIKGQIFEPFFSTRSGHRGLGLAMVAGAARQHGGDVRVYSQQGQGARFDVVLPRDTGLKVPDSKAPPKAMT